MTLEEVRLQQLSKIPACLTAKGEFTAAKAVEDLLEELTNADGRAAHFEDALHDIADSLEAGDAGRALQTAKAALA